MNTTITLITPAFTQLNTPYPATAYIKGFLNTLDIPSYQADLGIEVILSIFSKKGLARLFDYVHQNTEEVSLNVHRILAFEQDYIASIDAVIAFLQGKNPTLAHGIVQGDFLPRASRFDQLEDLHWAFGDMGIQDKAKHLATLYLEDLSDLIQSSVDANFGFSRYAERLGRSAHSFDELYTSLKEPLSYVDQIAIEILEGIIQKTSPKVIGFSIPFPGNLYSGFRCAQYIKANYPGIAITMGGGFPNTELRDLKDVRVFEFFDFITLDDGEAPLENLIAYVEGKIELHELKRTLVCVDNKVQYINNPLKHDYKQNQIGTPDYSDLPLKEYISVIEIVNPMHRMWSDGRWNKLTMAHGCYWGKCTFCDISLDYIRLYEPVTAKLIVDRMQELVEQTSETGFHFVDEAAPPALMREVALEIIRRKLHVTWWTNIRFEKSFTQDLCYLLKASGCIAVSGGLEVASDRLLKLIDKGVTVEQVAKVNRNFTQAGILVHAYLMYGFPTQSAQETIDSLEMVRQMFENGVMQSGFWHQFAMTAHSPVGMDPKAYKVESLLAKEGTFANNDVPHRELNGNEHEKFSFGLRKSLYNFMHHMCLDWPLQDWFEFKVPKTSVAPNFIENCLNEQALMSYKANQKVFYLGSLPFIEAFEKKKKGRVFEMAHMVLHTKKKTLGLDMNLIHAKWFLHFVEQLDQSPTNTLTYAQMKASFEEFTQEDFEPFLYSKPFQNIKELGLLIL